MSRPTRRLALAGALALALPQAARAAAAVRVRIPAARTAFEPAEVRIKLGDTVEWLNRSIVTHTVTCDPAKAKANAALPPGAAAFDSGILELDATFTHTFTVAGTYRYVCLEHESMGMVATVVVER